MHTPSPRILYIEDDDNNRDLIRIMLLCSDAEYEIISVPTPEEGLSLAASRRFDLYMLSYRLPGIPGLEVCRTLRRTDPDTPILFFTGEAHERDRQEALRAGADAYLIKPDDLKKLAATVQQLLEARRPAGRAGRAAAAPPAGKSLPASEWRLHDQSRA